METLQRLLGRHHRQLREAAVSAQAQLTAGQKPPETKAEPLETRTQVQRLSAHRRDKRLAHYQHVVELHHQGASIQAIAQTLCMSRRTVRRFVRADAFPE